MFTSVIKSVIYLCIHISNLFPQNDLAINEVIVKSIKSNGKCL